jgi:NAD+ kinase
MRIALYSNEVKEEYKTVYKQIFNFFASHSIDIALEAEMKKKIVNELGISLDNVDEFTRKDISKLRADLVLSIGGDGTFLSSIFFALENNIPIAGINCGRLGFLADIPSDNIEEALSKFINGEFEIETRDLLQVVEPLSLFNGFNIAMNEITVHKLDNSSMIKIETIIDGEFLASYWADGLIVSTPTGSTAYSLSVGGPIVMPNLEGLVITPIASHNLTVRPFVVPNDVEIELHIEGRGSQFLVSSDHRSVPLDFSSKLVIRKSQHKVLLVKLKGQSFYSTLRNKLMWGADKRN